MYQRYVELRDGAGVTDYKVAEDTGVTKSTFFHLFPNFYIDFSSEIRYNVFTRQINIEKPFDLF